MPSVARTILKLQPASDSALVFTGERFTPESRGAIWYEHWHRYCFAAPIARGKRVVDAACGEGYGSALLAREAASVVGVDIGGEAIAHASARYRGPRLHFVQGSVTALPLRDATFDVVVSFETIEHLSAQREMLAEFRRVLTSDGVLVLSSPNRPIYSGDGAVANPFHVRELDRGELKALLDERFPQQQWYAQCVASHSLLWSEHGNGSGVAFDALTDAGIEAQAAPAPPMYFVVVCAANGVPLRATPALSTFDDGELSLWNAFAHAAQRERQLIWDELDARKIAEDRLADLVTAVNALRSAQETVQTLRTALDESRVALDQARATLSRTQLDLAHEANAHRDTKARLAFRESLIGWLRWPLSVARRRFAVASAGTR